MPYSQSNDRHYIHVVFCTKNRYPFIKDEIEVKLFEFIGGICNNLNCRPIKIGGYRNHIHILCIQNKNILLTKLIQHIKSSSSKWIKTQGSNYSKFSWQVGYGSFSVSAMLVERVSNYIKNQKNHHQKNNFEDEFINLLQRNHIEVVEKYLWD